MFTQKTTRRNHPDRTGAIIGAAAITATLGAGTAALAQGVTVREVPPSAGASAAQAGSEQAVLQRAARMLGAARERQAGGPVGAREAYRSAESALLQMFTAAGQTSPRAIPAGAAAVSLTPAQAAQDIKALRARGMDRAANFYATAAKEFFTGQLREALLEGSPSANQVARVRSVAYARDSQRGGGATIVIRGDENDRRQAQAQGQKALRDAQDAELARQREREAAAINAAQQQQNAQNTGYAFYPYAAGGGTLPWSVPGAFYNPFTAVPIYGQQPLTYGALPPGSVVTGPGGTTVTPTFYGGFGYSGVPGPYGGGFFGLPY